MAWWEWTLDAAGAFLLLASSTVSRSSYAVA